MNALRLKEILDAVRQQADLKPVVDKQGHVLTTFCNIGLDRILGLCGVPRLVDDKGAPLMANDMIEAMRFSPAWVKVTGDVACARASQGILVVATQAEEGHGHVAACYPAPMAFSGSWGKDVPILNNIGKTNGVLRASQCFRTEPIYYSVKI